MHTQTLRLQACKPIDLLSRRAHLDVASEYNSASSFTCQTVTQPCMYELFASLGQWQPAQVHGCIPVSLLGTPNVITIIASAPRLTPTPGLSLHPIHICNHHQSHPQLAFNSFLHLLYLFRSLPSAVAGRHASRLHHHTSFDTPLEL